jgi:hypothetical protein
MSDFKTLDHVPDEKFKGYYCKAAREIFRQMTIAQKKDGGYLEEKNEKHLMGIYYAMKGLIRQGEFNFEISLDKKAGQIWIKKPLAVSIKEPPK